MALGIDGDARHLAQVHVLRQLEEIDVRVERDDGNLLGESQPVDREKHCEYADKQGHTSAKTGILGASHPPRLGLSRVRPAARHGRGQGCGAQYDAARGTISRGALRLARLTALRVPT